MTAALTVWLRRSTAARLWIGLVVAHLIVFHSRAGWAYHWVSATDWLSVSSALLPVLLAGMVANDVGGPRTATLNLLSSSTPRGSRSPLLVALASSAVAFSAWLCVCAYAAIRLTMNGAPITAVTWWFVLETASTLLTAALFGAAVGRMAPGKASGLTAAALTYGVSIAAAAFFGVYFLFRPGGDATGLVGWERNPVVSVSYVLTHLGIAAVVAVWTVVGRRRTIGAVIIGIAFVSAVGAHRHVAAANDPFRVADRASTCRTAGETTVCTTDDAGHLVDQVAIDLATAEQTLNDSRLPFTATYMWVPRPIPEKLGDAGLVSAGSILETGRLTTADVASTLSMPRLCAAQQGDTPPKTLLEHQETVRTWIEGRLNGTLSDYVAPPEVIKAFESARKCQ